jgi:RNA polymerase sigma-70 factor (ECF subfamily)
MAWKPVPLKGVPVLILSWALQQACLSRMSHFATTRWSVVHNAALPQQRRQQALDEMYRTYFRPLCGLLVRDGVPAADAEDVAQEFFLQFFQSKALAGADPARGRFRSFLMGAVRHHVLKWHRRAAAQKRGGGAAHLPLVEDDLPPVDGRHEDETTRWFDREWARTLFGHSLKRLEQENEASGLAAGMVHRLVLGEGEGLQQDQAASLGLTPTALKTRVFRLRRRLREIVREEVRFTVSSEADLEAELEYLSGIISTFGHDP